MKNINLTLNPLNILFAFLIYIKKAFQDTIFNINLKLLTTKNKHFYRLIKIYKYLIFSSLYFCIYWLSFIFRILTFFEWLIFQFKLPKIFYKNNLFKLFNKPLFNFWLDLFIIYIISQILLFFIKIIYFNFW